MENTHFAKRREKNKKSPQKKAPKKQNRAIPGVGTKEIQLELIPADITRCERPIAPRQTDFKTKWIGPIAGRVAVLPWGQNRPFEMSATFPLIFEVN